MHFKNFSINDLERVIELEKELYLSPWNENMLKSELENKFAHNMLLVDDNDTLIGFIGLWIVSDYATITKVSIAKAFQGNHYSEILMDKALELCEEEGCSSVDLEVRVENMVAINLYKKYDFTIMRVIKDYYGKDHDGYHMLKAFKRGRSYEKVYISA